METLIREHLRNPEKLEELYHGDTKGFAEIIRGMYHAEADLVIKCWYARLFYKPPQAASKGAIGRYALTAVLVLAVWIPVRMANLAAYSDWAENMPILKLIPVLAAFALSLYHLYDPLKEKFFKMRSVLIALGIDALLYGYLLLLPQRAASQSIQNAFYFMFVLLWFTVALARSDFQLKNLRFGGALEITGEIIVWSTLFTLGGAAIVLLSLGLFNTIGISASGFYENNIVPLGLTAAPFVSLLVMERFAKIKLSVIIANIFLPIILVSIAAFGISSLFTETKPYTDKDIFILYNIMMVIVVCVLAFTGVNGITNPIIGVCAALLPAVTILLDMVTISAVIYRIAEYGVTPNKITLLGTNLVMLGHLVSITVFKIKRKDSGSVPYLPVYAAWAFCVVFLFPFIFRMA